MKIKILEELKVRIRSNLCTHHETTHRLQHCGAVCPSTTVLYSLLGDKQRAKCYGALDPDAAVRPQGSKFNSDQLT
ncbi:hypothetical protein M5K25_025591 [Dendrobium thyrsiflorum]|uniref:Uncharacterized protein n=1 Tax=Dendrobium thyrsiflorum TaxID=117978 RepID=A0ABD0U4J0_DENTH